MKVNIMMLLVILFLLEDKFYSGELIFRDKAYTDIEMRYDVYEHQLVISYSFNNRILWIVLPNEFITEFHFNDMHFKTYLFEGKERGFYQEIGNSDSLKCLYFWSKSRNESDHMKTYYSYEFSKDKRTSYLLVDNKITRYKSNSSFLKIFPDKKRGDIKNYLSTHKIKVTKSSDKTIEELIDFCSNL